jgi:hypothetical protein
MKKLKLEYTEEMLKDLKNFKQEDIQSTEEQIKELITKYEDKIKSIEILKNVGGDTWGSESPTKADKERFETRIYERKTFIKDLNSLLKLEL